MRIRALALVLSASAVLSACGGQPESGAPPQPPRTPVDEAPAAFPPPAPVELDSSPAIEQIRQRGKLIVGIRSDEPKFVERAGAGEYRGFDVEIARILTERIGLDAENGIAFRRLPPELVLDSMSGGNVDVQLGGFDPSASQMTTVGPYVITGPPGAEEEHFIGIRPGDDAMREELQRILDEAIADGSWQRAYDSTLGKAGVQARPLPR